MSIELDKLRQKKELAKHNAAQKRLALKSQKIDYVTMPELTGDPEIDSKNDLAELQNGFKLRAKLESDRFRLATDSEYWACICFQTREQKEHFLKILSIIDLGDKYLDGQMVAKRLGIELPAANVPYNVSDKEDKKLIKLT